MLRNFGVGHDLELHAWPEWDDAAAAAKSTFAQ